MGEEGGWGSGGGGWGWRGAEVEEGGGGGGQRDGVEGRDMQWQLRQSSEFNRSCWRHRHSSWR